MLNLNRTVCGQYGILYDCQIRHNQLLTSTDVVYYRIHLIMDYLLKLQMKEWYTRAMDVTLNARLCPLAIIQILILWNNIYASCATKHLFSLPFFLLFSFAIIQNSLSCMLFCVCYILFWKCHYIIGPREFYWVVLSNWNLFCVSHKSVVLTEYILLQNWTSHINGRPVNQDSTRDSLHTRMDLWLLGYWLRLKCHDF